MFGIGGSELIFVVFIILMLFGSDKIPEIARSLGKGMAQIKHATNDIKTEINKSAKKSGLDKETLTGGISEEINKAKEELNQAVNPLSDVTKPIQQTKEDIENLTGPIKRQQ